MLHASKKPIAVLVSGGLDSAVLLGELAASPRAVHPVYIRTGLHWEEPELNALREFLSALAAPNVRGVEVFDFPAHALYGNHWSVTGLGVPDAASRDEAVHLPGRNLVLTVTAAIWAALRDLETIVLGTLSANPFPDATPEFFSRLEDTLGMGLGARLEILRPYAALRKCDVLLRGRSMPLDKTFSCIAPVDNLHCGACNKCAERQRGFQEAELPDPTLYASRLR
jgi:7-cyano-7-deazaguanine synthase